MHGQSVKLTFSCILSLNVDISKIKGVLILKGIFSETTNVCVLTNQISKLEKLTQISIKMCLDVSGVVHTNEGT